MAFLNTNGAMIHYCVDGPEDGAPVLFSNSLGCDLRLWDKILPYLPEGLRIIRYDTRGHGLSDAPDGPYSMGGLVKDAEALLDHLSVKDAVVVGLSMCGMIAQGLAVKRFDLVRAVVLSNTGARIGTPEMWQSRIDAVQADGVGALWDGTRERWFTKAFQKDPEAQLWRNMYVRQAAQGMIGAMQAISGTDMITPTSGLRLPALGIAGSDDGSTPADMVRETVNLIPGSEFALIRRAGHLPCVEQPKTYAEALTAFLKKIGHV